MRHGFISAHSSNVGSWGTISLLILLIAAIIVLVVFLSEYFRKRNPENNELLEILKEKYVRGEISADEYRERSILLEDEEWLETDDSALKLLKEQYAKCEFDSREYVKRRDELLKIRKKSPMEMLKERYARSEISLEEFKKIKKNIQQ